MALVLPTFPGLTWPRDVSFGNFDTGVQTSVSGKITTYANRINPTRKYSLSISGLDSSGNNPALLNNSLQLLAGFFNQCYGRALSFQYTDPDDNSAQGQIFGMGDGISTGFQLTRTSGGFVEQVFAPVGAPSIYVAGALKTLGVDYTISATGKVSFVTAPALGASLTWSGSYNWWCNWDDDTLDASQFVYGISEVQKISFTTRIF